MALPTLELAAQVATVASDVCAPRTAAAAIDRAEREFGLIDGVANIAGAYPTALLVDTTDEHHAATVAANLTGTFVMCRVVLPRMLARGRASIVNKSSSAARLPTPGLSIDRATKVGVARAQRSTTLLTRSR